VRFHTALGEDDLSRDLDEFAAAAGIDCKAAPRLPGATPGDRDRCLDIKLMKVRVVELDVSAGTQTKIDYIEDR